MPLVLTALFSGVVALVVATALVPLTMILARHVGGVDRPDDDRRIHTVPTPRLGGLAMCGGFAAAVMIFGGGMRFQWAIIALTVVVTVAMAVDDIYSLPWWTKLALEVGMGLAVAASGILITFFAIPGLHGAVLIRLGFLAVPLTVIWIVGLETSINLIDGVDGVAAGVMAIVAVVLLIAAVERLHADGSVQPHIVILSAALMGCCLGFLIFNFAPARVFMGDSGSHFLGVAVGIVTILGVAKVAVALALGIPILALGVPIGDTAFAIWRRRRGGGRIAVADRGHIHHRLLALGLSARETALAFYLATAMLGFVGLAILGYRLLMLGMALVMMVLLVMLLIRTRQKILLADAQQMAHSAPSISHDASE